MTLKVLCHEGTKQISRRAFFTFYNKQYFFKNLFTNT